MILTRGATRLAHTEVVDLYSDEETTPDEEPAAKVVQLSPEDDAKCKASIYTVLVPN